MFQLPIEQGDDNQERRQEKGLQKAMGEEVRAVQRSGRLEGHQHGTLQLELVIGSAFLSLFPSHYLLSRKLKGKVKPRVVIYLGSRFQVTCHEKE